MKFVSYKKGNTTGWGRLDEDIIYPAKGGSLLEYIQTQDAVTYEEEGVALSDVTLTSPIPNPVRNIYCVGRNYMDHIMELNNWDEAQRRSEKIAFFTKATTTMNAPYGDIPLHEGITEKLDYEAELAIVIGKGGVNIDKESAMEHVFGYSILNDVSARDLQKDHLQWLKGKSLDGCAPMGPWIVTKDDIKDPHDLAIESRVNDEVRQSSNTKLMMWKIADIISILSQGLTLLPGDIISTGTPAGVGMGMEPPQFLKEGDVVTCTIEGIGSINNKVSK